MTVEAVHQQLEMFNMHEAGMDRCHYQTDPREKKKEDLIAPSCGSSDSKNQWGRSVAS
jgi:hypothetical protein